jgi:hypothetical protein
MKAVESIKDYFQLKKPCSNCPFLLKGGIGLREGRLEGITQDLLANDRHPFPCHKTALGEEIENDDGEYEYVASGHERMCAGASAYLMKHNSPTVGMRMAFSFGDASPDDWNDVKPLIID